MAVSEIKATIGIDRKPRGIADLCQHRLDASSIVVDGSATDLHLDNRVAPFEITAHFRAQRIDTFPG
jgi:hypothetical protein